MPPCFSRSDPASSPLSPPVEDLLAHLGHRITPFLPTLIAIALKLLDEATRGIAQKQEQDDVAMQQQHPDVPLTQADRSREVRTSCLKLLAQVRMDERHTVARVVS